MRIADLYIRVSTDEQADKGYSQRNQEETLRRCCEINSIRVRKVVFEDHSAKTFIRPEWEKLLSDLRKLKGKTDLILFTKWDRFSRNAGDAYQMISTLRKLGVEPQAVEQPLDLSVPENKMMLAFYLATPEVENDRRALNGFYGMRRAKKEGRWMPTTPIGYINKTSESGRKYIALKEPEASIMRWVFQELSKGIYAADQIRKEANKRGLKCARNNFWNVIRNPVYCGKIVVEKFKDEETMIVQGQHEPLISESLFYEVQDILNGKKRHARLGTSISTPEAFPLRGFLICPECGRLLTASASKGRDGLCYYYHCISSCGVRFKADNANSLFIRELKKYVPNRGLNEIYVITIKEAYSEQTKSQFGDRKKVLNQLEEINTRLKNARTLLAYHKIDAEDFRELKIESTARINELEAKLTGFSQHENNIDDLLNKAVFHLSHLTVYWEEGTVAERRNIVSSIFPEKLTFDGFTHRTARVNEAARLIYSLDAGFKEMKNGKNADFSRLSRWVVPTRIELVSKV
jgi:site-specific DNA recombinase